MWTLKTKVYYILYKLTASWLPESRHLKMAKILRNFWASHIISEFGKNINIERNAKFTPELRIGDESGIGVNAEVYGTVIIGKYVMMGPEVIIYTRNHKHKISKEAFFQQGYEDVRPVTIGDNVWIGRRAMFMPGSAIGKNSVVAAGTVVTKKFGDGLIIGGVPAKIIGYVE